MPFCKICSNHYFERQTHKCPPIYEVCCPEMYSEDEWECVREHDAEEAAKKWAEEDDWNTAEYTIVGGEEVEVWVRLKGKEKILKFVVTGESLPNYYATPLEE